MPVMWKTGHSLIKDKMQRDCSAPLAGEMSGHMFFTEGFYGHDDALYGAARLLRIVADSGTHASRELLADVPDFVSTPEIRVDVRGRAQVRRSSTRRSRISAATHDVIDVDGVRVLFGDGWGLIRASNTQPVLVARYEARTPERLAGDPRRDGRVAARAGRRRLTMTTRRWLVLGAAAVAAVLLLARPLRGRRLRRLSLVRRARRRRALARAHRRDRRAARRRRSVAAALFAFVNLYAVRQSVVSLVLPRRVGNIEIGEEVPGRYLAGRGARCSRSSLGVAARAAVATTGWRCAAARASAQPFGETDPYFGADLGFFVYWLPFESMLYTGRSSCVLVVDRRRHPALRADAEPALGARRALRRRRTCGGISRCSAACCCCCSRRGAIGSTCTRRCSSAAGPDGAFTLRRSSRRRAGDLRARARRRSAPRSSCSGPGWIGQMRLAGVAVIAVVVLVARSRATVAPLVAPHVADRRRPRGARAAVPRDARRLHATRVRASTASSRHDSAIALSVAAPRRSPWVSGVGSAARSTRAHATRDARGDVAAARSAWRTSADGLVARRRRARRRRARSARDAVDGRRASSPPTRTSAAAPLRVRRARARRRPTIAARRAARVSPARSGYASSPIRCSASPASRSSRTLARARARVGAAELPRCSRRAPAAASDASSRIATCASASTLLAPFFVQGRRVAPIVVGDSLYWAVDLYSASTDYPLSRRDSLARRRAQLLCSTPRSAIVARVDGRRRASCPTRRSIRSREAGSSASRRSSAVDRAAAAAFARCSPPPVDGAARAGDRVRRASGSRGDSLDVRARRRRSTAPTRASSATSRCRSRCPARRRSALALPLLDEQRPAARRAASAPAARRGDRAWYPLVSARPALERASLDRLRAARQRGTAPRDGPLVHGRVRVVPVAAGIGVRPADLPRGGRTARRRSAASRCSSATPSRSIAPRARRRVAHGVRGAPAVAGDVRAAPQRALRAMRDALRRGDWVAFGRAFDALGRALGRRSGRHERRRHASDADATHRGRSRSAAMRSRRPASSPRSTTSSATRARASARSSISRSTDGTSASCTATARRSAMSSCATRSRATRRARFRSACSSPRRPAGSAT